MTTHQPPAQPNYLTELGQIYSALGLAHLRLHALMDDFRERAAETRPLPDEWHDCYRASQALYLAVQLTRVAVDNEKARNAPVPFLPVEVIEQASALIAGAIEAGIPVIVED